MTIFVMRCGFKPFVDSKYSNLVEMDSVRKGAYSENKSFKEYSKLFQKIDFPEWFGEDLRDLVRRLLDVNPDTRLGAGPRNQGIRDIKAHRFFSDVDWELLEQRHVEPPYKPPFSDAIDEEQLAPYDSFEDLMHDCGKQCWLLDCPDAVDQDKFANWYVIASQ